MKQDGRTVKYFTSGDDFPIDQVRFSLVRKKPVEVRAYKTPVALTIETLEGNHKADKGDWIIRGIHGELYPCKPDIFKKTYDIIEY